MLLYDFSISYLLIILCLFRGMHDDALVYKEVAIIIAVMSIFKTLIILSINHSSSGFYWPSFSSDE